MYLFKLAGKSSSFRTHFDYFSKCLQKGCHPAKDSKNFIFLCGANQQIGVPSERRKALIQFANKNLPHCQYFLAEPIFEELKAIGSSSQNLLDLEKTISDFADSIVIVLESASAFCELGAFSVSKNLRQKIVVVNDTQYENAPSFINHGPLAAIKDSASESSIIHYRMSNHNNPALPDGIGAIFGKIAKVAPKQIKTNTLVPLSVIAPSSFSKEAMRFVQDVITLFGPISHNEIIQVAVEIFGKGSFDNVKHLTALLRACDLINVKSVNDMRYYTGKSHDLNFAYPIDVNALRASIQALYMRRDRRRLSRA